MAKIKSVNFKLWHLFGLASLDYTLTLIGVRMGFMQELNPIVDSYLGRIGMRLGIQILIVLALYVLLKKKVITQTAINIIAWAECFAVAFVSVGFISGFVYYLTL